MLYSFIRFGGSFVRRRSRVRGCSGGPKSFRSVLPNVSRKDFHNRTVVPSWGVLHREGVPRDPFQSVDAAETYLKPRVPIVGGGPKLVDGTREAFRDLLVASGFQLLLGDLDPPPREVEPEEKAETTDDLRPSPAVLVHQGRAFFGRHALGEVPSLQLRQKPQDGDEDYGENHPP